MQYQASHQIKLVIDASIRHLQQQGMPLLDNNLLHHILTNIISNAVKYSPIEPSAAQVNQDKLNAFPNRNSVECNSLELYVTYEGNEIVFCVQDYGIGIPPEMLPNLFQPFYRGYNVGQIPGTGLGLALVKQCVDLHQGQIKVASELNYGSTFTMWVPVIQHSSHIATNMIDVN